jgi:hypothetical protein
LAPNPTALNDGHGGLIQRGTNARIFRTSLSAAQPRSEEDQEKHEARLATALNIDRVQRVLDFDNFTNWTRDRSKNAVDAELRRKKTYWDGMRWVKDESISSEYEPAAASIAMTSDSLREHTTAPEPRRVLPMAPFK